MPVPSGLNPAKLSQAIDLAVGSQFSVTDGFYLHEGGQDYFYFTNGTEPSGGSAPDIEKYTAADPARSASNGNLTWRWNNVNDATAGGAWGDNAGNYAGLADDSVTHFWDTPVEVIDHTYTLTHPALQALAAPDNTTKAAMFLKDSLHDGLYIPDGDNWRSFENSEMRFQPVGDEPFGWQFRDDGGPIYYSLSVVADPSLASDWKNASDDSDAAITVTSVSAGELAAGLMLLDVPYQANGSELGRVKYTRVDGLTGFIVWTANHGGEWEDNNGFAINTGNVSTPDKGTPEVSCLRDDVAAEENWILSDTPPPPSDNADLASLTPSYGDLNPPFNPAVTSYRLNSRDGATLVAVPADAGATVESPITLQRGVNSIVVTAEDGITTKTYTVDLRNPGHAVGAGAFAIQLTPEQIQRLRNAIEEEEFFIILAGIGC